MRAGGLSFLRLAMPVYILALLISIGAVAFNEFVVPRTNNMYQTIVREEIMKNASPQTQNHIVLKSMNGDNLSTLMYAKHYDSESKKLSMITVQQFNDKGELQQVENAENAEWNGQVWVMHSGIIYDVSAGEGVERTMKFKEQVLLAWIKSNPGFVVGIDDLGDSDTIAAAVHKGNSSLLEFINNEITGPLAEENFFHKDYEETLAPIYGDEVDPNTMVVEGGKI